MQDGAHFTAVQRPRWTKWPGVPQVAPEITGPDRL